VFVSGVVVAGRQLPVAELGATAVGRFELAPDERQIQIDFSGLSFGVGDPIRFQYRLVGADRNWSAPAETRSVSYAQLTRGEYRFEVRAVGASGVVSAAPAVVSFRVLAPVWARWWFIAAAVGAIAVGAHLAYRMRTARLVEVERIRTRIAADLHDDIGANLSRIAMMSDVAQTQLASPGAGTGQLLASVASISRESVDAMSDIVWAVDPSRDRFKDLAQRMRRVASDVLSARDITVTFRSAGPDGDWPLGADVRREVLLIFKEAVNNLARHSAAREATIDLAVGRGLLILTVADNGRGFDGGVPSDGNGLVSMRRRAERLGGQLTVTSTSGRGTVLELRTPLR
jgi:signal transduction histidine kinase